MYELTQEICQLIQYLFIAYNQDFRKDKEKTNIQKMKKNVPFRYGPTITNYHWKCLSSPMLQFFAYSNLSLLLYFY